MGTPRVSLQTAMFTIYAAMFEPRCLTACHSKQLRCIRSMTKSGRKAVEKIASMNCEVSNEVGNTLDAAAPAKL